VAADLLAQAEHGPDSQAVLVTTDLTFVDAVNSELKNQVDVLPRAEIARQAIANSYAIVTTDLQSLGFSIR